MMVLVIYDVKTCDIGGRRRLRRVAKICQNFGQRVQWSAFECWIRPEQWKDLRFKLVKEIDEEQDRLRFYFLGSNWRRRMSAIGVEASHGRAAGPMVMDWRRRMADLNIETGLAPEGLLLF